jgi:futalosine hydrolase
MPGILLIAATDRELFAADGAYQLCCGIGPVEAALATAQSLAEGSYAGVLHVGIAGAAGLRPGTLVIGSEAIYCDVRDPKATLPRVDRAAAAPAFIDVAREIFPHAPVLPIGTCARVGGGFQCEVEAMEGFGVLRAAGLAGVPALEVRVVSNAVEDADRSRWKITDALAVLSEVVPRLVPALLDVMGARPAKRTEA